MKMHGVYVRTTAMLVTWLE